MNGHPPAYTSIGLDLRSEPGVAVLGVLQDGVWSFRDLNLEAPETFAGLKVDAVWVEETDLPA